MVAKHSWSSGSGGGFVPAQEMHQLNRLLYEYRGDPGGLDWIEPLDGEKAKKSFRIWSARNIAAWRLKEHFNVSEQINIQNVSQPAESGPVYQVDFLFKRDFYTLRITQVSANAFNLIIQNKSVLVGLPSEAHPAVVWSKNARIAGSSDDPVPYKRLPVR